MTFFTLVFGHLAITEANDAAQLLILKPKISAEKLEERRRRGQNRDSSDEEEEGEGPREQSCLYEAVFCGGLRRCLLKNHNFSSQGRKRCRIVGLSIFTLLTLVCATVMEMTRWPAWSDWFPSYAPHYSESDGLTQEQVDTLDRLNWVKSSICAYLVVVGLLTRLGYFICYGIVSILGGPCLLCHYMKNKKKSENVEKKQQSGPA